MTDIPEDIRKAARNAALGHGIDDRDLDDICADIAEAILAERGRWIAVLTPFRSGGDWGAVKAYITEGAPSPSVGAGVAKTITQWQVAIDKALAGEA